ncbi:MAG: aspartyl/asparaginyl beta-hydroxylase domain-containing protein [Chromatiales bacterium]|nr:aspartyl/asparaginyl beta-hydroxylase domain-containing protein [Chromatiales bacterium]
MLDLPDRPLLDKDRLIGGCLRLPLVIDAARLAAEIESLGTAVWGTTDGRVGVHRSAEAIFLRGHAPAEGELPIHDRPLLDRLPGAREVLALLGAPPLRCLLARLPAGGTIAPHIDRAPYFAKTIRIHVPVTTSERVFMYCAGYSYRMRAGEAWALNNSTRHGVWNADPELSRTHLICDFLPAPPLLALLAAGERSLGRDDPEVERHLTGARR